MVDLNATPFENDVGQFGANNETVPRYKQAAQYAADAQAAALIAATESQGWQSVHQEVTDLLTIAQATSQTATNAAQQVQAAQGQTQAALLAANQANASAASALATAQGLEQDFLTGTAAVNQIKTDVDQIKTDVTNIQTDVHNASDGATAAKNAAAQSAADAQAAVANAVTVDKIAPFTKFYQSRAALIADLPKRTIGEWVAVWDDDVNHDSTRIFFKTIDDGTGHAKIETDFNTPSPNRVVEHILKTVNGNMPDSTGNVSVQTPSGNPSLWLGEVVLMPWSATVTGGSIKTYPGLLPQDGRLISRVEYSDLWAQVKGGYLPCVLEADWQAGKKVAFSYGPSNNQTDSTDDGTPTGNPLTFRIPQWSGQNIKAVAPTDPNDVAQSFAPQKPYITSVNGVTPVDATGAVVIPNLATVDGTGTNINIKQLTGLTTSLGVQFGGTGVTTYQALATALQPFITSGGGGSIPNPLPIAQGGTGAQDAPTALTNLGGTSVGTSIFTATTTDNAQTAIGMTAIGRDLITSVDAADARSDLSLTDVAIASFPASGQAATATQVVRGDDPRLLTPSTIGKTIFQAADAATITGPTILGLKSSINFDAAPDTSIATSVQLVKGDDSRLLQVTTLFGSGAGSGGTDPITTLTELKAALAALP